MYNKRRKNLFVLPVLVAIAMGVGSAYTAANTLDATAGNALGYGTQTVTGAHVTSMHYTLSTDGVTVDTVTFVAAGDVTLGVPKEHGYVGFTYDPGSGSVVGAAADCGIGVYDGTTATTFTCDVTGLTTAELTVHDISSTNITVAG